MVQKNTDDAKTCDECGTTENVVELTLPETDVVTGYNCEDCLEEAVEEINAELDEEAEEEIDGLEISTSAENLSPDAAHVRRVVRETVEDFIRNHSAYGFHSDSVKVWNAGDYGEGYGVVFTLPFRDEEIRHAFFESTDEKYYEDYPEGVNSRLNSGYFEWVNGYAFEWVQN